MTTIVIAFAGFLSAIAVLSAGFKRHLPRSWIDSGTLGLLTAMAILSAFAADVIHEVWPAMIYLVVIGMGVTALSMGMSIPSKSNPDRFAPWSFFAALVLLNVIFGVFKLSGLESPGLVYLPLLIVGIGIPVSRLAGRLWRSRQNSLRLNGTNIADPMTFFVVAFLCLVWGKYGIAGSSTLPIPVVALIFIASFLAILKSISVKGLAWLWVPLAAAYWLGLPTTRYEVNLIWPASLVVLAFVAYRRAWLSPTGSLATLLLGWVLVVNDQPRWVLCALLFFAVGTAASKLPGRNPWKEESRRTGTQVFSNGGVPIVFIAAYHFFGEPSFLIGGLCGLGSALSDTLSSEIGVRRASRTWSMLRWKTVPAGQSGGVSTSGLIAGLIGAAVMGVFSAALFDTFYLTAAACITGVAFTGNLIDSLLGDSIQAKYHADKISLREVPLTTDEQPVSGWKWVDNNTVNLLSTAAASLIGATLWWVW